MAELRPRPARHTAPPATRYVLIAVPNRNRAAGYRAAILSSDYETLVVRDGEQAKQVFGDRGAPALLIVDPSLPKIDGFELLRELRKIAGPGEAGAVVISGHSAVRAAAQRLADSLGISKVLPLDVDRTALTEAVGEKLKEQGAARPAAPPAPPVTEKPPEAPARSPAGVIDASVARAAGLFGGAVTLAYVKFGTEEWIRGRFGLSDPEGTVNAEHVLSFLRHVAVGTDPLIVPDVTSYPALSEFAPNGLPFVRGFAATPLAAPANQITGALCVMDTRPVQMDASELDQLDGLGRELARELVTLEPPVAEERKNGTGPVVSEMDALERLASTDTLTGLANRRGGEKDIGIEISRARRQNTPLSCVLLDLDHFKDVNDTFGHQAGDYALREVSALLRRTLRAYDIIVRWGGEEFLIVMPGVDLELGRKLAERLRSAIEALPLAGIGGVTASLGLATLGPDYSFENMFAAADKQLYLAKSRGRNTIA